MKRKIGELLLILMFFSVFELLIPFVGNNIASAFMISAPSSRTAFFDSESPNNPGYYWCQNSSRQWQTDSYGDGIKYRENYIDRPEFSEEVVTSRAVATPRNSNWVAKDYLGGRITKSLSDMASYDIDIVRSDAKYTDGNGKTFENGRAEKDFSRKYGVKFSGFTGNSDYGADGGYPDNGICGDNPGYIFPFPITVTWKGEVPLQLEIEPAIADLPLNSTTNLKVTAVWKYKSGTVREVIPPSELTYQSDAPAKVGVSPEGIVTAVTATNNQYANVKAYWEKWDLAISAKIKVIDDGTPSGDFDVIPNKITYGESFNLVPKNIQIPRGKTLKSITYTIHNPSRTESKAYSIGTSNSLLIDSSKYPNFFNDKESIYPIDMIITDSGDRKSSIVSKTVQIVPKGTLTNGGITGDFTINPNRIKFREPFSLVPKDIKSTGLCTYKSHSYKIDSSGSILTTEQVKGQTTSNNYTYGNYPGNIGVGTHDVYMKIYSS